MSTVPFEIVTPDRIVLSCEASMVVFRSGYGELGVLPRHTPLATTVKPGLVKVKLPDGTEEFVPVTGGFIEVLPDRITLLADAAELGQDIDVERAERALEQARKRLAEDPTDAGDELAKAINRAENRLQAARLAKRQ